MIIRLAEPRDVPALLKKHREQNKRDKTRYPFPQLFDKYGDLMPKIDLALVVEENGEALQAIVFEHVSEMMVFGCDPRATAFARRDMEAAAYLLALKGIEVVRCVVPKKRAVQMGKPLAKAKFRRKDKQFAYFVKELSK